MVKPPKIHASPFLEPTTNSRSFEEIVCALLSWFVMEHLGLFALVPFLRSEVASFLLMVALGITLGRVWARPILRVLTTIVLGLWIVIAFTPLTSLIVQPLKVAQPPEHADAIVVLQAGIQKDNDFATPTMERTLYALGLMQQGFAQRLILTEDWPTQGSHEQATAVLMKSLHLHGQIFSVGPIHNTHDEALLASTLLRQHGWNKILLVTSPTHSRRALFTFRKTGLQVISTPCRETSFDFENLSLSSPFERTQAFAEALREIVGMRTYQVRGWA